MCFVSCVLCLVFVGGGWVGGSNFGGINAYAGAGERELTLLFTLSIVSKNPTSRVTVFPVSSLTKICPCGCVCVCVCVCVRARARADTDVAAGVLDFRT